MNAWLIIACGAGFQDGFSPCVFMLCAVFIMHRLWFSSASRVWRRSTCLVFVVLYMLGVIFFNFGPGQFLILSKTFILAARIAYLILGLGVFVLGVVLLKDWILLRRNLPIKDLPRKGMSVSFLYASIVLVILSFLALGLSALATLWPVDHYVVVLGNENMLHGLWQKSLIFLLTYIFVSLWPLWLVWVALSLKNLPASLLRILCACVFFIASSSIILMFR